MVSKPIFDELSLTSYGQVFFYLNVELLWGNINFKIKIRGLKCTTFCNFSIIMLFKSVKWLRLDSFRNE